MVNIQISGHPLASPMTFTNVTTDIHIDDSHWLLTKAQATDLLTAWRDADRTSGGEFPDSDLQRAFHYSPMGIFVTALHMDGELTLDEWESAYGMDDFDVYSTSQIPLDVEIKLLP